MSYLTEELVKQGHEVALFASGDSHTEARLVPQCKRSLRTDPNCLDQMAPHICMLEHVFRSARDFDVIHFHTDYFHYPVSSRLGTAHVTTLHGRLDLPELPAIYRLFASVPLVSISDSQRSPIAWANWCGTVYHGLPKDLYSLDESGGDYLAFLGRISPEKGVDQAVEIARRAGMRLRIAAKVDKQDYDYFESIKDLFSQPHVEFLHEIGDHEKQELIGHARALLFPIDWPEPFGLVMIEAMACGTPVIAFPRGSVPEVIDDGVTGFVAADAEQALAALEKISSLDRRLIRQVFEKRFSACRMARDYAAIYEQLAGEEAGGVEVEQCL